MIELRPRQVALDVFEVIRDPVAGPLTHDKPGHTLRALRDRHGDVVSVTDPVTGAVHHASLDRWATSDPDATLISWRFRYSVLPRWLRRLR
jgi:hypothetical protein